MNKTTKKSTSEFFFIVGLVLVHIFGLLLFLLLFELAFGQILRETIRLLPRLGDLVAHPLLVDHLLVGESLAEVQPLEPRQVFHVPEDITELGLFPGRYRFAVQFGSHRLGSLLAEEFDPAFCECPVLQLPLLLL